MTENYIGKNGMFWRTAVKIACFSAIFFVSITNANSGIGSPADFIILLSSKTSAFELQTNAGGYSRLSENSSRRLGQVKSLSFCANVVKTDYTGFSGLVAQRLYEKKIRRTLQVVGTSYNGELVEKLFKNCSSTSQNGIVTLDGHKADIAVVQFRDLNSINYDEFRAVVGFTTTEVADALIKLVSDTASSPPKNKKSTEKKEAKETVSAVNKYSIKTLANPDQYETLFYLLDDPRIGEAFGENNNPVRRMKNQKNTVASGITFAPRNMKIS